MKDQHREKMWLKVSTSTINGRINNKQDSNVQEGSFKHVTKLQTSFSWHRNTLDVRKECIEPDSNLTLTTEKIINWQAVSLTGANKFAS